ncbi:hypothetical protein [Lacrimispora algidixylanolytica]|uniref:Lipoprotein n=1 Tax=Lacrimispora algidixylanolytica TaxID=94868 RepID=A0A419TBZ2_9FIRM|nr:hypothetical protein [Lacrimispora algidixylanolytica]RKD35016.1 hypothetical protein BET01_01300 [Lacrimispora algidixylanolytica]
MKRKMIIIATTVLSLCMFSGCQKSQLETLSQETESSYQSLIKVETTTLQNEDKKTEIQNSNQSSEVNEETNSNITLDESRIIKDQTFVATLNDWGEVTFVTYGPKPGADFEDVTFYLMKNKKVVYAFPFYGEDNKINEIGGLFDSVASIGFRDVNHDDLEDIIVIINYVTGAGPQGMVPRPKVRIFRADKKEFHLAKDLIDDITNQMNESDLTINGIYKYLKSK